MWDLNRQIAQLVPRRREQHPSKKRLTMTVWSQSICLLTQGGGGNVLRSADTVEESKDENSEDEKELGGEESTDKEEEEEMEEEEYPSKTESQREYLAEFDAYWSKKYEEPDGFRQQL